jgi:ribosomal protein L32
VCNTLVIAAIIGLIPAAIAYNKGKDFWVWWFFGAAIFIVALPMAILAQPDNDALETRQLGQGNLQKCPYCAELIKSDAVICKHCGKEIPLNINHNLNLHQDFVVLRSEAQNGAEKIVEVNGKRFNVKIPAGIKDGTKLRIKGKGMTRDVKGENISGDLYLKILIKDDEIKLARELNPVKPSVANPTHIPNKLCPKCGVPMEIRVANSGEHQGKKFYVCPNYKQCQQVFPIG